MIIASHLASFPQFSLEQAVGTAARLGFRTVDLSAPHLNVLKILEAPEAEARAVQTLLKDYHIQALDLSFTMSVINAPEEDRRQTALQNFGKLLNFVALIQPRSVTVSAGALHDEDKAASTTRTQSALPLLIEAMKKTAPGVRLLIEPTEETVVETVEEGLRLLENVLDIGLTLDMGTLAAQGNDLSQIAVALPKVGHLRVRQAAKDRSQTPFEAGSLNMRALVDLLYNSGYSGGLSIRYLDHTTDTHGAVAVDPILETVKTRDALRDARQAVLPAAAISG